MAVCAVIDNATGEQVNLIVADLASPPPVGCYLIDIPEGLFWDGAAVSPIAVVTASSNDVNNTPVDPTSLE